MIDKNQNPALFKDGFDVRRELVVRALHGAVISVDAGNVTEAVAEAEVAISLGGWLADTMRSDLPGPAIGGRVNGTLMALVVLALPEIRATLNANRVTAGSTEHTGGVH